MYKPYSHPSEQWKTGILSYIIVNIFKFFVTAKRLIVNLVVINRLRNNILQDNIIPQDKMQLLSAEWYNNYYLCVDVFKLRTVQ